MYYAHICDNEDFLTLVLRNPQWWVQTTIKDVPFESAELLNSRTDEALHSLKDLRVMLHSLGLYV